MNKLPRSGVWAPALTPPPPLPSREGGEWGVGWAPPHSPLVNRQVRVFILQGKTCLIFLSMLPNKSSMLTLFNKNRSL